MTKQEFDELSEKEKRYSVMKALAWFCVQESLNPFAMSVTSKEERETIKIILGKIKDGEISLN